MLDKFWNLDCFNQLSRLFFPPSALPVIRVRWVNSESHFLATAMDTYQ